MTGIYFLLKNKKVVYIGQSRNVKPRIAMHKYRKKDFDNVRIIECSAENLLRYERRLLSIFKPPLNGKTGGARERKHKKEPTKTVRIPAKNPLNRYKFKDRDGKPYEVIDFTIEGAEEQIYSNHKAEGLRLLIVSKL